MSDKDQLQTAIERIAKMKHAGVPDNQIAAACGIEVVHLEVMLEKEAVKTEIAKLAGEDFEKFDTLNAGWDMVENIAMNNVVKELGSNPDPDYALKAAALANKAQRRGRHENNPIAVQVNNQAIIQVAISFADKLAESFNVKPRAVNSLQKKDNNFLPPKEVNVLLGGSQVDKELDGIAASMADLGQFAPAV